MKIKIEATLIYDNEIQFADTCIAIADELNKMAQQTLINGDYEQYKGITTPIYVPGNENEPIGTIRVPRSRND